MKEKLDINIGEAIQWEDISIKGSKVITGLSIFATIMILIGVAILLYPIVGNHIAEQHRRRSVAEYQEQLQEIAISELEERRELAREFNESLFNQQQGFSGPVISYEDIAHETIQVMGTVDVPALGIQSMPFYYGTSSRVLDMGLGHFELSSIPVGGVNTRSVITGHSGVTNQLLFSEIQQLREGDIFFINILGERLAYEIESFEEILPTEIERVAIVPDRDMATLLTCTPPGINTYRLLVNGFRLEYEEAIHREVVIRNFWSYQRVVLGSLAAIAFLFLLTLLRYLQLKRRIRGNDPVKAAKGVRSLKRLLRGVKVMFVVLFIATIVVISVAIYGYTQMQEQAPLESMFIGTPEEMEYRNLGRIINANYEERQIASVNISNYSEAKVLSWYTINDYGIGRMQLPDVGIDLPVLAGIANINLLTGGSTYRIHQRLGQGNYVLLAHSIYGNDEVLFQPLKRTRIGDFIYITDFISVYIYQVVKNEVVRDTQVEVIEELEQGATPIITLIRCEGNIGTIYRRVVQGELVGSEPLDSETMETFALVRESEGGTNILAGTRNPAEEGVNVVYRADNDEVGGTEPREVRFLLLRENPISFFQQVSMGMAARMVSDPIQVGLPLFLLLLFPILFLSMLPNYKFRETKV